MAVDLSFNELESAYLLSDAYLKRSEYRQAYHVLAETLKKRTAVRVQQGGAMLGGDLQAIERLATLALLFGQQDSADDLLHSYVGFANASGNRYAAHFANLMRAQAALTAGDTASAWHCVQSVCETAATLDLAQANSESLSQWEASVPWEGFSSTARTTLLCQFYLVFGRMLLGDGQYQSAKIVLARGRALGAASTTSVVQSATSLLQLGYASALLESGELDAAESELNAIRERIDRALAPGAFTECSEILAKLFILSGRFGEALAQLEGVISLCEHAGFARAVLHAKLNLGHILILLNRACEAEGLLDEVSDFASRMNESSIALRAQFLAEVARARASSLAGNVAVVPSVYQLWGDDAPAVSEASSSVEDPLSIPAPASYLSLFEERALAFHWYLSQGNLAFARKVCDWLKDLSDASDSPLIKVRMQVFEAMLLYQGGHWGQADNKLQSAREHFKEMGARPELWQVIRLLGWCAEKLRVDPAIRKQLTQDAERVLKEITESLPDADQAVFLMNKWTEEEQFLAGWAERIARLRNQCDRLPWYLRAPYWYRYVRDVHALLGHLEQHKIRLHCALLDLPEADVARSPHGPLASFAGHSVVRTTIRYLVLPDRLIVIHQGFLRLDFGVTRVSRLQLRALVATLHKIAKTRTQSRHLKVIQNAEPRPSGSDTEDVLDTLARTLQLPAIVSSLSSRIRAIVIEPDDVLHGVPFSALKIGNRHLVEILPVSLRVPLGSTRASAKRSPQSSSALIVAVSTGSQAFEALPGTLEELKRVQKRISAALPWRVETLCDSEATKDALVQRVAKSRLAHLACHGVFQVRKPDGTGVVLIPKSGQVEILSVRELAQMDLSKVDQITLSSCWAADNFILPGRWVISLPQVLRAAGAGGVLACLWPVDDHSAIEFMDRYYHHLMRLPRDVALQRTQIEFIRGDLADKLGRRAASNPFFWAGFAHYGETTRIS